MSYAAAKKRAAPYTKIVEELPQMRREAVQLVREAVGMGRRAFVLVNNRAEGNAQLHWSFVTLGWCGLFSGTGGVAAQIVYECPTCVMWSEQGLFVCDLVLTRTMGFGGLAPSSGCRGARLAKQTASWT
jgi:hypothetical protein